MGIKSIGNKYFLIIIIVAFVALFIVLFFVMFPSENSRLYDISNISIGNMTNKTIVWSK